jgi:hypothetical protein
MPFDEAVRSDARESETSFLQPEYWRDRLIGAVTSCRQMTGGSSYGNFMFSFIWYCWAVADHDGDGGFR